MALNPSRGPAEAPGSRQDAGPAYLVGAAEMAKRLVDVLSDRQADDVLLLDVRQVAPFTDYFIIATAENPRHMRALVGILEKDLRNEGMRPRHVEGERESGWVLLDYGDVVVHLLSPEMRDFYALEDLWSAASPVVRIQ